MYSLRKTNEKSQNKSQKQFDEMIDNKMKWNEQSFRLVESIKIV